jgi:triosephosphate isomerase
MSNNNNKRQNWLIGNWKMNGSLAANASFFSGWIPELQALHASTEVENCFFGICPPDVYLPSVGKAIEDAELKNLVYGGQNVSSAESGAFTGQVGAGMYQDLGAKIGIVGHSERRSQLAESNEDVIAKAQSLLSKGIRPVLCIGESLEDRQADRTEAFVSSQVQPVLEAFSISELQQIIWAYEPIWAIGTGLSATFEQADSAHAFIRGLLSDKDPALADSSLLYGGSLNADNAQALLASEHIDGGLVGGASLKAEAFIKICQAMVAQA